MQKIIDKIMNTILGFLKEPMTALLNNIFGGSMLSAIADLLSLSDNNESVALKTFYDTIDAVFDAMKPLGFALIVTYFIIHLMELSGKGDMTFETVVKAIISLVAAAAIAANSKEIINAILQVGESAMYALVYKENAPLSSEGFSDSLSNVADTIINNSSLGTIIIVFIFLLIMWLVKWVVYIGIYLAAFSRFIDIGWRAALMPIGIANLFTGGAESAGIRYLKSFLASVFSGVMMVVVVAIGNTLSVGVIQTVADADFGGIDNVFEVLFKLVMALACMLATMGAAIGIPGKAKELIS